MPVRVREARGEREQGTVRKEPVGKGVDRPVVGGGRAELQPTVVDSGVSVSIRSQNEDEAGRGSHKAEPGEAGESVGCVRQEACRDTLPCRRSVLPRRPFPSPQHPLFAHRFQRFRHCFPLRFFHEQQCVQVVG